MRTNARQPSPVVLAALLLMMGCSSTRQIETAPPVAANERSQDDEAVRRANVDVVFTPGTTPLPDDIQALRFRIAEIGLKEAGGGWTAFPADVNAIEIGRGRRVAKVVLSTRIAPVTYDSLALTLRDIFVTYGPNAGGPLTMARGEPVRLPLSFTPPVGRSTTLQLTFEPAASLTRDASCRWFFLPFILTEVREGQGF